MMIDAAFINKIWFYVSGAIGLGATGFMVMQGLQIFEKDQDLECGGGLEESCGQFRTIMSYLMLGGCALSGLYLIYIMAIKFTAVKFNF